MLNRPKLLLSERSSVSSVGKIGETGVPRVSCLMELSDWFFWKLAGLTHFYHHKRDHHLIRQISSHYYCLANEMLAFGSAIIISPCYCSGFTISLSNPIQPTNR